MTRWISFVVLLGVIVVIAAFFIRVMAEFLVPLFVATLLVVIFRPVHLWFLEKTNQRPAISALLTTVSVILAVVLPFAIMFAMAAAEGREIVKRFDRALILQKLSDFRSSFGLNVENMTDLSEVESSVEELRQSIQEGNNDPTLLSPKHFTRPEREELSSLLAMLEANSQQLGDVYNLSWPPTDAEILAENSEAAEDLNRSQTPNASGGSPEEPADGSVPLTPTADSINSSAATTDSVKEAGGVSLPGETEPREERGSFLKDPVGFFVADLQDPTDVKLLRPNGNSILEQHWFHYVYQLRDSKALVSSDQWSEKVSENRDLELNLRAAIAKAHSQFREFKVNSLGGPLSAWIKELANPQEEEVQQYSTVALELAKSNVLSWSGTATLFIGRLLFGSVIAVVAVYFFLLDGPGIMESLMQLSPMDDRHERELIEEFDRVSRAVVLATLVAAIAQGLLAAIGFYVAGIQSVFLLMMLTMLLAMIPFFGATSVWLPVVFYLAFFEGRPVAAGVLFLYSALIVSTADNIIKPYILHGQSNLHPLLALLSVLGGVTALGAIGIVVGPMLVAFLQTLLKILRDELLNLDSSQKLALESGDVANLPAQKRESVKPAPMSKSSLPVPSASQGQETAPVRDSKPDKEQDVDQGNTGSGPAVQTGQGTNATGSPSAKATSEKATDSKTNRPSGNENKTRAKSSGSKSKRRK